MESEPGKLKFPTQYSLHEKLRLSLFKLLDMNYDVTDDSILSKLTSFLSEISEEDGLDFFDTIYMDWLSACTDHWKKGTLKTTTAVFSIQILRILCQNSEYFQVLSAEKRILEQFRELIESKLAANPLFPIAYAKLLSTCICHEKGLDYTLENELWRKVLSIYVTDKSLFVKKECKEFLVSICSKASKKNLEDFAKIMSEIFEIYEKSRPSHTVYAQKTMTNKYTQILNLLTSVFEKFLVAEEPKDTKNYFASRSSFYDSVWSDFSAPHSNEILLKLSKLLVLSKLMNINSEGSAAFETDLKIFLEGFMLKILSRFLENDSLREISLTCELTTKYCRLSNCLSNVVLENLLAVRLTPLFVVLEKLSNVGDINLNKTDFPSLDLLNISLSKPVGEFIILYKQALISHTNLEPIAIASISALEPEFESPSLHSKLLVFKALTNLFHKYFIPKDSTSLDVPSISLTESRLTTTILAQLKNSISKSDVPHLELHKLLSDLVVFLSIPGLAPTVGAAPALNLARDILQALPKTNDTSTLIKTILPALQGVLLKYMYSISWEVRDSAIEVLSAVADFSKGTDSTISLQLAKDVFAIFMSDTEYYVRASAILCLCKLVTLSDLWSSMDREDVTRKLLDALRMEDEAIVRRQIPLLLTVVYKQGGFPEDLISDVYSALVHACTKDLHWEVCINALDFWQAVIMGRLKVPDLQVPSIRSFFVQQLTELNNLGCFRVIVKCLYNEADLEVCKKAAMILDELSAYLNKFLSPDVKQRIDLCHELSGPAKNVSLSSCSDTAIPNSSHNRQSTSEEAKCASFSDEIINSIVTSKDISLLADVYKTQHSQQTAVSEPTEVLASQTDCSVLTEIELINMFTKINAGEVIKNKIEFFNQSQNNLESLLNDILLPGFNNTQNPTLDCY